MSALSDLRADIVELGAALYDRGVTHGRTGNLSARSGDRLVLTPTGVSLGRLDPARFAVTDLEGNHLTGDAPTKELALHLAFYQRDPDVTAVAHTHSTHAAAISSLADLDPAAPLEPLTAYYAMRVGVLPLLPYYPPGDLRLAAAIHSMPRDARCALLANHGPIAAANSLEAAVDAIEEIEETARLALLLHGRRTSPVTPAEVGRLHRSKQ